MDLSKFLKSEGLSRKQQYSLILCLGAPAILAQLASVAMQYIDAAMVGSLGAAASASIGVVMSSTWIAVGLIYACAMGFSVQVAHAVGANDFEQAQKVFRAGLIVCIAIASVLSAVCIGLSQHLPAFLGADQKIWHDSSSYFFIYACFVPAVQVRIFAGSVLQCAGNTKIPSILNSLLCLFDIIFNYFLIFPSCDMVIGNYSIILPRANLGVAGAALGTALSEFIIAIIMLFMACRMLKFHFDFSRFSFSKNILKTSYKISAPMAVESIALNGAHVFLVSIVAPLGTVALAADIFGFTMEQICYLPGFGISIAATTLVGQALGAKRPDLAREFAWSAVRCGVTIVTSVAIALYILAPTVFEFLTPDVAVQKLGTQALRIELFSEPLFAASTVIVGALRGAKDTFVPSLITLGCKWGVLLPLSLLLVKNYGLVGVWFAICADFCVRGILFLLRLRNEKSWMKIRENEQ